MIVHWLLMGSAAVTRRVLRWTIRLALVAALLIGNAAVLMVPRAYDALSDMAWSVASLFPELASKRPASRADIATERDVARKENNKLQGKLNEAVRDKDRLELQLRKTTSDLAEQQHIAEAALGKNRRLVEAGGPLIHRMQNRVMKATARNTSENFIEAAPLIGTGIALGSIAWDIRDGCAQISDLQELDRILGGKADKEIDQNVSKFCGMSAGELWLRVTGKDPAFEDCVKARIRTHRLDPPECAAYPDASITYEEPQPTSERELPEIVYN